MARRKNSDERQSIFADDPVVNVLSRTLAWESAIRRRGANEIEEIGELVRRVRYELGMPTRQLAYDEGWYKSNVEEIDQYASIRAGSAYNWRFLNLPSHLSVRNLAWEPVIKAFNPTVEEKLVSFEIILGEPAYPSLKIYVGSGKPTMKEEYINKRAIYMLLLHDKDSTEKVKESLYIGKADVAAERMEQHIRGKDPIYYFMAFPNETEPQFNGDVRDATEALMIGFWSEIAEMANGNLGTTIMPLSKSDFHMSILLTTAISAAYVYGVRKLSEEISKELALKIPFQIPFLNPPRMSGWPICYTQKDPRPTIVDDKE